MSIFFLDTALLSQARRRVKRFLESGGGEIGRGIGATLRRTHESMRSYKQPDGWEEEDGRRVGGQEAQHVCAVFADLVRCIFFNSTSGSGCWTPEQQCSLWFDPDQIKSISAYSGTSSYIRFTTILVVKCSFGINPIGNS